MAKDKEGSEDKDHKEAGSKKKTRKIVETTTEDITHEKKHSSSLSISPKSIIIGLGVIAVVFTAITLNKGTERHAEVTPPYAGGAKAVISDACAGKPVTITLKPGKWHKTDQYDACRVVSYVPPGVALEAMDAKGTVYELHSNSVHSRGVTQVRAVSQTVSFSYSRCPKGTAGALNWDCSSLSQYATQ